MASRVRGTFEVVEVTRWKLKVPAAMVKLESIAGGLPENQTLSAEGAASISIMVKSADLIEQFQVGREFYVDFTAVK